MSSLAERYGIPLSEADLAKVGVLAALEAKAKFLMMATLKGVAALNNEEFEELDKQQLRQLTERVLRITPSMDARLHQTVEEFDRRRKESHETRHKFVHALWAHGEAETVVARDIRRREDLRPTDLDDAMVQVAELARAAQACAFRTAQLILEGRLKGGESRKPAMYVNGLWVNF